MTQQFSAADLFRRVAPEVAARFAFRMPPNIAAEREAEMARIMAPRPRSIPSQVGKRENVNERKIRLMNERRAAVPALHAKGLSTPEIAAMFGVQYETIAKDLKALGLSLPISRRHRELRAIYVRNMDYVRSRPHMDVKALAAEMGVSSQSIYRYRRDIAGGK